MKAKKKEEDFYKKYPECRIKISFSNNVSGNNQILILDQRLVFLIKVPGD